MQILIDLLKNKRAGSSDFGVLVWCTYCMVVFVVTEKDTQYILPGSRKNHLKTAPKETCIHNL